MSLVWPAIAPDQEKLIVLYGGNMKKHDWLGLFVGLAMLFLATVACGGGGSGGSVGGSSSCEPDPWLAATHTCVDGQWR